MNLPGAKLSLPSLSPKDKADLRFGIARGVDYIALSFVRTAKDIIATRLFLKAHGADIPIIAKIEKPEAVHNLDEIIEAADGIMVARGDLGVEMSPEKVPLLQKKIIEACHWAEKPVITATQMLESMIESPQPTRAEVSDVANAILDGTDCVMLSGETAVGDYPVQAVEFMSRIALQTETSVNPWPPDADVSGPDESVAHAACRAAEEQQAKAIVTFTQSGSTALRSLEAPAQDGRHRGHALRACGQKDLPLLGCHAGDPESEENHGRHDLQCGADHARQRTGRKTRPDRDHRGCARRRSRKHEHDEDTSRGGA